MGCNLGQEIDADSPEPAESRGPSERGGRLAELNECMSEFGVTAYRDSEGRFRLYGDINRMQEVVDGRCGPMISESMHADFRTMFRQIDKQVADCLRAKGLDVEYDPELGINMADGDTDPQVVDECIYAAYALYELPPQSQ